MKFIAPQKVVKVREICVLTIDKPVTRHDGRRPSRPVTVPSKIFQNPRRNGSATRRTEPVEASRRAWRTALVPRRQTLQHVRTRASTTKSYDGA
jgi:hypothetical protein